MPLSAAPAEAGKTLVKSESCGALSIAADAPLPRALARACDAAARAGGLPGLGGLTLRRLALLALQRSAPVPGAAVTAWAQGDDAPLTQVVLERGDAILAAAIAAARADAEALAPHLAAARGGMLTDIGCGHGLVTAFLCRLIRPAAATLIDVEDTDFRGHYWNDAASGYSELGLAVRLVAAEGVAPHAVNPRRDPMPGLGFDAAVSTFSCGFHYPAASYAAFLAEGIRPGGAVSLDLRRGRAGAELKSLAALQRIAPPVEIGKTRKMRRILFRRPHDLKTEPQGATGPEADPSPPLH